MVGAILALDVHPSPEMRIVYPEFVVAFLRDAQASASEFSFVRFELPVHFHPIVVVFPRMPFKPDAIQESDAFFVVAKRVLAVHPF